MIAACMPVIVVPRSNATVEIDTFITVLSRIITNCDTHRSRSTDHRPMRGTLRPRRAEGIPRGG